MHCKPGAVHRLPPAGLEIRGALSIVIRPLSAQRAFCYGILWAWSGGKDSVGPCAMSGRITEKKQPPVALAQGKYSDFNQELLTAAGNDQPQALIFPKEMSFPGQGNAQSGANSVELPGFALSPVTKGTIICTYPVFINKTEFGQLLNIEGKMKSLRFVIGADTGHCG